ncbi:MAG: hypothetical protein CL845_05385 [Crocinitomicaceae bacterium]|nr:hypothetical protein [Crocinitomicaceae bacterium]
MFEEIHEAHGPEGTNEVRILFIESDDSTTDEDLHGSGTNTWGDWTAGVEYPMADNGGNVFDLYQCAYYPTVFTVCPNRIVQQTGQATAQGHISYFQSGSCAPATMPNDVSLLEYLGPNRSCPETPTPLSVKVMNQGTEPLTAFTLTASTLFGTELITYDWTGNLGTYEMEVVELGEVIFPSTSMFFIDVTSGDDYDGNNSVSETMNLTGEIATSLVRVRFTTDNMPGENRWDITDGAGDVAASTTFGDMTENQTEYEWWVNLGTTGCYNFTVYDQLGNGGNIECDISTFNEEGENINTIFTVNNSGNWTTLNKGFLVNEVNMTVGEELATPIAVYPNPTNGLITLQGLSSTTRQLVEIRDAQGKIIFSQQRPANGDTWVLDLNALDNGLYILTVIDGNSRVTQSIVRS